MLMASKRKEYLLKVKKCLKTEFYMKDLGHVKKTLSMKISIDKRQAKMSITQTSYGRRIITKFKMNKAKLVKTTLAQHFKL